MAYLRDQVFILRHEPLREHDAWISMFGRKHGKIVGIARGHRKARGKQLGHLEPLVLAEVMVAEGKRYDRVAVSRVVESFHTLRSDLPKVVILSSCLSLADALTRSGVGDERVFLLMEELFQGLDRFQESPSAERGQLFYSWFALRLLGFYGHVASFSTCVSCRCELNEEIFSAPEMSGAICGDCNQKGDQYHEVLSPISWKLLRMVQGASCDDIAHISTSKAVFREANHFISQLLLHVPADREPHGYRTIASMLA